MMKRLVGIGKDSLNKHLTILYRNMIDIEFKI